MADNIENMVFTTQRNYSKANIIYLQADNWDDWFKYETLYHLIYIDDSRDEHNIGSLKIGQFEMEKGQRRPKIPSKFKFLDDTFFSVGQDVSYYENLNELGEDLRDYILAALKDIALNHEIYEKAIREDVTKVSLLRDVSTTSIEGQFRRLAQGNARLSSYRFSYTAPKNKGSEFPPMCLSFNVEPDSNPPTNIHVLIGRNGVGKTFLLDKMINSLIDVNVSKAKYGYFTSDKRERIFANLVSVTFSAFDNTEPLPEIKDKTKGIQYSYIGLKRVKTTKEPNPSPKSPIILRNEFVKSIEACRRGAKNSRWKSALKELESDVIFKESEITSIADIYDENEFKEKASELFNKLSSGHKIVLLTITRLVETVEEKSLVLLDEPESHLHPPLLSAFIRALSNLLIQRNGVAIIATHSPVVLQEVPQSCVWKLRRTGANAIIERLETESFGENIGILTREVFGLEVTYSGFHKLLMSSVNEMDSYEEVLDSFNNELGLEAKAIVKVLFHQKNNLFYA